MGKVISNLTCQLGNQLFQIAVGYSYAKRTNQDFYIHIDSRWKKYPCIMNNFQTYDGDVSSFYKFTENKYHDFIPEILETSYENVMFTGFFQSEEYFNRDIILPVFKNIIGVDNKQYRDCVGIQVRRGDYLKNPQFNVPTEKWYDFVYKKYFTGRPVLITSDDIQWCKEKLCFDNVEYTSSKDPVEDIKKMSVCRDFIISASTYGWWCAYLSEKPDSKVIGVSPWFNLESGKKYDRKYPDRWLTEDII